MSPIEGIYNYAEKSEYIDTEHVIPLGLGIVVASVFYFDIRLIIEVISYLNNNAPMYVLESVFKGIVGGLITTLAYTVEETSFKIQDAMQTKEKAMGFILVLTLLVGFGVNFIAPEIIQELQVPSLQLLGFIFVLALIFVHLLVDNWRLKNEWPHLLGGGLVIIAPLL
jgi:hypothetical protein